MTTTTDGQRWHAYADGEYVGTYPSQSLAHAAACASHEQTVREQPATDRTQEVLS